MENHMKELEKKMEEDKKKKMTISLYLFCIVSLIGLFLMDMKLALLFVLIILSVLLLIALVAVIYQKSKYQLWFCAKCGEFSKKTKKNSSKRPTKPCKKCGCETFIRTRYKRRAKD